MPPVAERHLKAYILARYGLPDIPYPVAAEDLHSSISKDGELPLELLLFGLQQRLRAGNARWHLLEPAMDRLAEVLAPNDSRDVLSASGDTWWLEVRPIDLLEKLVTVQHGDTLIAAIRPREDGRLRVAVYLPLDAKSAHYLIGLGLRPHPVHGVNMRENNWEYALDRSAGTGNFYAAERGEANLSQWLQGLGERYGEVLPDSTTQLALVSRPAGRIFTDSASTSSCQQSTEARRADAQRNRLGPVACD
jgi:hypothetical protein